MDNDIEKEIQSRFEDLPEDVQRAIQSEEVEKKLQSIGQKFQLHIDQMGKLGDETRMVMLGFVDPIDFAKGISEQLNMEPKKAEQVAEDISSQIFNGIRDSMQEYVEQRLLQEEILKNGTTADKGPAAVASIPQPDKSVVMPSAAKAPEPAVPIKAPLATPATEINPPVKPPQLPVMDHIDTMLSQPTVSVAPQAPAPAPAEAPKAPEATPPLPPNASPIYKSDPYHEPID